VGLNIFESGAAGGRDEETYSKYAGGVREKMGSEAQATTARVREAKIVKLEISGLRLARIGRIMRRRASFLGCYPPILCCKAVMYIVVKDK